LLSRARVVVFIFSLARHFKSDLQFLATSYEARTKSNSHALNRFVLARTC